MDLDTVTDELFEVLAAGPLSIGTVIIPRAPGHFSACGMLVADLRRDFVNTWFTPLADASVPAASDSTGTPRRSTRWERGSPPREPR